MEKTQEIYGTKTCLYCKHYKTKIDEFPCADCSQSNNGRMGYSANLWEPVDREENANDTQPTIKDSGERRVFETGAVRDITEDKGRCDLLPLDVVADIMELSTFENIALFKESGEIRHLERILQAPKLDGLFPDASTMFLEVAKHFEEGAKKYGEYNWQKGIPVHCYIDSGVRHYLKWLRGDKDERHDRSFVWNIICCIWTCKHKPELNDYAKKDGE